MSDFGSGASFWDHLDELRARILRILLAVLMLTVVVFLCKDVVFSVILAPHDSNFLSFRLLGVQPFAIHLVNTGLTEQFMAHLRTSMYVGLLLSTPYIIYEMFTFVSPALYAHERRYVLTLLLPACLMFFFGILLNYFLVFPLTVHFLGTYQVSTDVTNMLTLQSYVDTLIGLSFMMGAMFELPILCLLLARMGIITSQLMSVYRRHAVVAILVLAAIITPTTDAFTLFVVAFPLWMLYEVSIFLVKCK